MEKALHVLLSTDEERERGRERAGKLSTGSITW